MWSRLLLAIDQYDSGQIALQFTIGMARNIGTDVRVIHVREVSRLSAVLTLENSHEAHSLVEKALVSLRMAGVNAEGRIRTLPEGRVAHAVVEESAIHGSDAIVLGARRLSGISRVSGRGVRERILRVSALPVIVAPSPLSTRNSDLKGVKSLERDDPTGNQLDWQHSQQRPRWA
jgi:nucleotide-binding universal stress UspA family protein